MLRRTVSLTALLAGAACAAGISLSGCDDPEDLFPPDPVDKFEIQPAAGGLRRLTGTQLRNTIADLLGPSAAALLSVPQDQQLHGFQSIEAAENAFTPTAISAFESSFTLAVDDAISNNLATVAKIAPCASTPTEGCFTDIAKKFGRVAWRRPVTDEETAVLVSIAQQGKAWQGSIKDGIKYELMTILQSPHFLYITEVGEPEAEFGFRKLNAFELATRMSFFILDRGPDAAGIDAAEQGKLATDDQIRAEAQRLLKKPEAQAAWDRFVGEVYFISDLSNVSKDPGLFPNFTPKLATSMQQGMYQFIRDIVWTRNADAHELFTSSDYFVDANLAPLYGVTAPATGFQKMTIPAAQKRAGIIGTAGFLARFAHPDTTSPTRRGRFIQERLLCNDIPPPPPGQNTNIPLEEPGQPQTMKQRLVKHKEGACATCHDRMDPLGFALENYDAMGAFRTDDRGLPLDTTGEVAELGKFASAVDIGKALSTNDEAMVCIVKNFIRESMGHLEIKGENDAIDKLNDEFKKSKFSIQALMAEMCVSPAFKLVDEPK
ncbi:MAG: DUF1592 domain-containing protein [Polyangiaceae bacterium]